MPTRFEKEGLVNVLHPQLNQRSKSLKAHVRNMKEGERARMVDDSKKHLRDKMEGVIQVLKVNCGVVQLARVKMADGKFNRRVTKLAPLF